MRKKSLYIDLILRKSMSLNPNHNYCLNCNHPYPSIELGQEEIFCINCGQSNKESKLSFWKLIKDGISNIFNLDSRIVHTIKDIIYPSKLTKTYIAGKRKYYVNPVRLFIFTLIAIVTSMLWLANFDDIHFGKKAMSTRAEDSKILDKYDDLVDTLDIQNHKQITDTIRKKLFAGVRNTKTDTIGLGENVQLFNMGKTIHGYGISAYDAVHLSRNQIYQKYKVEGFIDKVMVSQYIRVSTDPSGTLAFMVKNLTWAVMITLIFMSFFMKLLYIRKGYYTVEHSVLLLNLHSFGFLLLGLIVLMNTAAYSFYLGYSGKYDGYMIGLPIVFGFLVQLLSIKKYYGHNLFVAFIVQIIINTAYFIIFCFASLLVALISVFLY